MAKPIIGKYAKRNLPLQQACNDWAICDNKLFKITNLTFTDEEIEKLLSWDTGIMFDEFELCKNKRFRRIKYERTT